MSDTETIDTETTTTETTTTEGEVQAAASREAQLEMLSALIRERDSLRKEATQVRQDFSAELDRLAEEASEFADENEWCGVFEATMDRLGLSSHRTTEVEWSARVTLQVEVDSESWFDRTADATCITGNLVTGEVVVEVSGTRVATTGSCVCGDVTTDELTEEIEGAFGTNFEFTITEVQSISCQN
jgi:hypothetical protein